MQDGDGQVAVVTGAGSGIGRAIAQKFLDQGRCLPWKSAARHWRRSWPSMMRSAPASPVCWPTSLPGRRLPWCSIIAAQRLVNSADLGNAKSALETSDDEWDRYLDLNLGGTFRMCRRAVEAMAGGGAIVIIASVFGLVGFRGRSSYSAAKAG